MRIYTGFRKLKNRWRDSEVKDYHGLRFIKRRAKALKRAERQEAKKNIREEV